MRPLARRRQLASLQQNDQNAVARVAVNAAGAVCGNLKRIPLKAWLDRRGSVADLKAVLWHHIQAFAPVLADAKLLAYLKGRYRSLLQWQAHERAKGKRSMGRYDDAIEGYINKMLVKPDELRALKVQFGSDAYTVLRNASDVLEEKLQAAVGDIIASGTHVKGGVARMREAFEAAGVDADKPWLLETLARTEISKAYNGAGRAADDANPYIKGWEYVTAGDLRVRDSHEQMDGTRAPCEHWLWALWNPPTGWRGFNCVPGDTLVSGMVQAASKARYAGPLCAIETASGNRLRITPNHPVLTGRGWIPANAVREGETLFSYRAPLDAVGRLGAHGDNQDSPSRVEEVFETCRVHGTPGARAVAKKLSGLDLHSDAQFTDGKVHVVWADGILPLKARTQPLQQLQFAPGTNAAGALVAVDAERTFDAAFQAGRDAAGSIMRCLDLCRALGRGHARPLHSLRVGLTAHLDALPAKPLDHGPVAHAAFLRKALRAGASTIAADKVVRVDRCEFAGHVYDLQTEPGYFVAQGILISNCRCQCFPIFDDEPDDWKIPRVITDPMDP